ncbi:MAG: single-stranded-DNA-specific exonuclease RecJ [Nitrospinota bacterium]|nr:single-stranded-DNA-specific exonuclease RecJ [Nitrospinota bacterium]
MKNVEALKNNFQSDWTIRYADEGIVESLRNALDIPKFLARLLVIRNIIDPEHAEKFLCTTIKDMHDPFLMKGMKKAVDHLVDSLQKKKSIGIYGDFDVDGISSTTLLYGFFSSLGIDAHYYIPSRFEEGYGLFMKGIKQLSSKGCMTIVTVDCGISAHEVAEETEKIGVDLIITDHHRSSDKLPKCFSVVSPGQSECEYPFKGLSGVGIAFKLAVAIRRRLHELSFIKNLPNLKNYLDLVALGTIADLVPLVDENRFFVKTGLELLSFDGSQEGSSSKDLRRTGIKALQSAANLKSSLISSRDVSFSIAPRINSTGRVGNARAAVELLTCDDLPKARSKAEKIEEWNRQRRKHQDQAIEDAFLEVESSEQESVEYGIVLSSEKWHPGVLGIVASNIVEFFEKPAAVIHVDDSKAKGSVRSVEGIDVYNVLSRCSDSLLQFGGHKGAAGLTIKPDKIDSFRKSFNDVLKSLRLPSKEKSIFWVDEKVDLTEIDETFVQEVERLSPFGAENEKPIFVSGPLSIIGCPILVGPNREHLKLDFQVGEGRINSIGFGLGFLSEKFDLENEKIEIAFSVGFNKWRGKTKIQLELHAVRPFRVP